MPFAKGSKIRPGGRDVELFGDEFFSRVRRRDNVLDDFVNEPYKLQNGSGKGGTLMAFVNSDYVVKELSVGDHQAMLQLTRAYTDHILEGDSLLCRVYLHFQEPGTPHAFLVMKNEIGEGPFECVYDLKGCADDKTQWLHGVKLPVVRKRIWKFWLWCGDCAWSKERHAYYEGKLRAQKAVIHVTENQREKVIEGLSRDVEFLAKHNLMDYSLLVSTKTNASEHSGVEISDGLHKLVRRRVDGSEMIVRLAIIDWLQVWMCTKEIARAIKCLETNKATIPPDPYGRRFSRKMEEHLTVVDDASFQSKQDKGINVRATGVSPTPFLVIIAILQIFTAVLTLYKPISTHSWQSLLKSPFFFPVIMMIGFAAICFLKPKADHSQTPHHRGLCSSPSYLVAILLIALVQGTIAFVTLTSP